MSYSVCFNCGSMVLKYEKYCQDCVRKFNLKQDEDWDKSPHPNINKEDELIKDGMDKIFIE